MGRSTLFLCLSVFTAFAASTAPAGVVELVALKDNTMFSEGNLSNGAGEYSFAGVTGVGNIRRGLLAFDIAGTVPADATIDSVSLTLHMSKTIAGPQNVTLHRVLADWGESTSDASGEEGGGADAANGDATWLHTFFPDETWGSPGGDFDPIASASQTVADVGVYSWSSEGMVEDVETWLENPGTNFGWMLRGNESEAPTAKRFDTKENDDPGTVLPVLTIEYNSSGEVPATSGTGSAALVALLLALGTAVVAYRTLHE